MIRQSQRLIAFLIDWMEDWALSCCRLRATNSLQLREHPSTRVQVVASQTNLVNVHIHLVLSNYMTVPGSICNGYSYCIGDPAICDCKWHLVFEQIATQTTKGKTTAIYDQSRLCNVGVDIDLRVSRNGYSFN